MESAADTVVSLVHLHFHFISNKTRSIFCFVVNDMQFRGEAYKPRKLKRLDVVIMIDMEQFVLSFLLLPSLFGRTNKQTNKNTKKKVTSWTTLGVVTAL